MPKKRKKGLNKDMRRQVQGILLLALAIFSAVGIFAAGSTGTVGSYLTLLFRSAAGEAALMLSLFLAIMGMRLVLPKKSRVINRRLLGLVALMITVMVWLHLQLLAARYVGQEEAGSAFMQSLQLGLQAEGGGLVGALLAGFLFQFFSLTGSRIIVITLALIFLLIFLNISLQKALKTVYRGLRYLFVPLLNGFTALGKGLQASYRAGQAYLKDLKSSPGGDTLSGENWRQEEMEFTEARKTTGAIEEKDGAAVDDEKEEAAENGDGYQAERRLDMPEPVNTAVTGSPAAPLSGEKKAIFKDYAFPPLELLTRLNNGGEHKQVKSSKDRARLLESTLLSFGVKARVIHVQSGPTVTRFELQPEAGVKVSKIISLSDDLALNLAAPLVRIEAPIPGKAALGIEVPNKVIDLVYLREVMEGSSFRNSASPLTAALGKDITGVPVITDLTKMPHLLIAGSTGAGKSVCLNTVIVSILYKAGPDRVRFLMIDPKVVELSTYNGIPHLLMPVVTDPRKASLALRNMVREMTRRYELFASLGVRDINAYGELSRTDAGLEDLPYIVVIIDELADLMMVSPGEVEDSIARLAQMSRAAGIHLIIATQRPSVDVLTGIIKANITSRIAFTVSSQFDSRTILDMAGAEKLLGRGDMLFYPVGSVKPFRVQGAFISEAEVKNITGFIKAQGENDYEGEEQFLAAPEEDEDEDMDDLFAEAVDLVVRTGQASISLLQRRFRIGYTRAARLIDDLERKGVVGPFEGSKPREVLITMEQAAQICEEYSR